MKQQNVKEDALRKQREEEEADAAAFRRAIEKKKNIRHTAAESSEAFSDAPIHNSAVSHADAEVPIEPTDGEDATFAEGSVLAKAKEARVSVPDDGHDVAWHFPTPEEEIVPAEQTPSSRKTRMKTDGKANEKRALRRFLTALCVMLCMLVLGYTVFVFAPIPFIRKWRDIYIGTAMTTADHQWLATYFIPGGIIEEVMQNTVDTDVIGGFEHLTSSVTESDTDTDTGTPPVTEPIEDEGDILGLKRLTVGGLDYAGNEVAVVDEEEGLFISKIDGGSYKGLVMLVDDPSRVFVGTTPEKTTRGYRIGEMMNYYGDVVAGMNASGFSDPNDNGDGSGIIGYCMSQGESWGNYAGYMASIVFTEDDRLVVGVFNDWESYGIRDGMQFGPVLVANGEINIKAGAAASYGLHPRAAIGQRADGAIILLVIDGRDLTYSIGCTIEDMANIMMEYDAENAGCCDGGSSCVLAYEGEVLNKNSSANPQYGRRIPNAFLVRSKKAQNAETES